MLTFCSGTKNFEQIATVSLKGKGKHHDHHDHVVSHERSERVRERARVMVTPAVCHDLLDFHHLDIQGTGQTSITLCGGVLVWRVRLKQAGGKIRL